MKYFRFMANPSFSTIISTIFQKKLIGHKKPPKKVRPTLDSILKIGLLLILKKTIIFDLFLKQIRVNSSY